MAEDPSIVEVGDEVDIEDPQGDRVTVQAPAGAYARVIRARRRLT